MILVMSEKDVRDQLLRQLSSLFPLREEERAAIDGAFETALGRCEACFSRVRNKYYSDGGATRFDPLHGCQWAAFLYYLSNAIYRMGGVLHATRFTR